MGDGALFGWSLVHHRGSLYVGAPLAGSGKVFKCSQLTTSTTRTCDSMPSPTGLKPTSWYGGSLTGSSNKLYSCAFRYNWQRYATYDGYKVGKCFSLAGGDKWSFDFTDRYFPKSDYYPWFRRGFYGFSSTVDDVGDLGNSSFLRLLKFHSTC